MRAHIDPVTRQILGYYPEDIDYPSLPNELETITEQQWLDLLSVNAWGMQTNGDIIATDPNPSPVHAPTPAEKLAAAGLTIEELKTLLGLGA